MKKTLLILLSLILTGCSFTNTYKNKDEKSTDNPSDPPIINPVDDKDDEDNEEEEEHQNDVITWNDYGAFLGRSDDNSKDFDRYKYVSFEFDDFKQSTIQKLTSGGTQCFAYLNVGSLETYRTYYDRFSKYTFLDYENWSDERWIDVTNSEWQDFIVNTVAKCFKDKGASGVYLDNVDVYSIFKENKKDYSKAATALKTVINGLNNLGLKILMNGGAEFIDDMNDKKDTILKSIWAYHQEEVFSLIKDYDKDVFGKQSSEDSKYYKDMASIMKQKGAEVFFLEYTKDDSLKAQIDTYCSEHSYHYYCSSTVDLK